MHGDNVRANIESGVMLFIKIKKWRYLSQGFEAGKDLVVSLFFKGWCLTLCVLS